MLEPILPDYKLYAYFLGITTFNYDHAFAAITVSSLCSIYKKKHVFMWLYSSLLISLKNSSPLLGANS